MAGIYKGFVRLTATVRGAVLYKLGIGSVTQRSSRRNYGVRISQGFKEGEDPENRKFMGKDGRRFRVMKWFVDYVKRRSQIDGTLAKRA